MKKIREIFSVLLIICAIGLLMAGCSNTDTDTMSEMVKKEVTQQLTNTGSGDCYDGTDIPTYTSVTGVGLLLKDSLEDGAPIYRYRNTNTDDVKDYWEKLCSLGWDPVGEDDESTTTKFESALVKGKRFVIVNILFDDINEVWITYN